MKTDWKDDMFEGDRKYNLVSNSDGTTSLEDVTEYTQQGDAFGAKELNEIGEEFNELKKSVSDGKTLLAAAITAKRIAAAASDTFAVLAEKIGKIVLGSGNADKADVLSGKTFTNDDGVEYTGTMADKSNTAQSATPSLDATNSRLQMTIPATGKYNTASKIYAAYSTIRTLIGLTADKLWYNTTILELKSTRSGQAAKTWTPGTNNQTIAAGTCITGAQTIEGDSNLVAANIKKGVSIFGVTGTYEGWYSGGGTTYNRGSNDGQWYRASSAIKDALFETGQITIEENTTGSEIRLRSKKAYNLGAFTKLTITGDFTATVAMTNMWGLFGFASVDDNAASETIERENSPAGSTTSVVFDINFNATRYLGIMIPRYLSGAIYSIVLS